MYRTYSVLRCCFTKVATTFGNINPKKGINLDFTTLPVATLPRSEMVKIPLLQISLYLFLTAVL
jgi:hypothetical protein